MKTIFLLPLLLASACVKQKPEESLMHRDSQIRGPAYNEIISGLYPRESTGSEFMQVVKYGTSLEGRDLIVVRFGMDNPAQGSRPAVVITDATHGNEYSHIVDRLPRWIRESYGQEGTGVNRYLSKGGVLYIVPVFNPDGYEARLRENIAQQDLNRDFTIIPTGTEKFLQPETRSFVNYLENDLAREDLKLKLTMDYHCCMGALVYPWGYTQERLPEHDLQRHIAFSDDMISLFGSDYTKGSTFELLGYLSQGSSKDYYYAKHGALAFTFEGKIAEEHLNFSTHTLWWDAVLGSLSE